MSRHTRRTTVIAVIVALLAALVAGGGVWLAQRDGETPPTATGVTTAPTPSAGPTTPQAQTMTVRVYFHEQAPGPESDPGKVVPVSRTVPRSPKVATAALNELLRGPTAGERAAGYWSFFSDDTAGMLRSVRVTGGTGFADFRDFRRLLPNATSSYGSTALLAELDATLRQFPTIKRTLYAFNGEVPAFYEWLQLGPPWMPTGTWRTIAPAPIAGRDGAAAVWTGRQLLVWGGHGRLPGAGLRPLRDGVAYDPAADRWQPIPTAPAGVQGTSAAAAWTGTRMLVWDGSSTHGRTTGALYDPVRDRWTPIARGPALNANHSGPVWTGSQLVAWNGTGTGGIAYTPATNRWSTLPAGPLAQGGRLGAAMVWTGREVVIWSGWTTAAASPPYQDGAAYRPQIST